MSAREAPAAATRVGGGRRSRFRLRGRLLLPATFLAVLLLVGPPFYWLVRTSVLTAATGAGARLTLRFFQAALLGPGRLQLFGVTFAFAACSALLATVLGVLLAWLVTRTDLPGKRMAFALAYILFATPLLLRVVGWILLFNGQNGFVWIILRRVFHVYWTFPLYSFWGMVWVQALLWLPVAFLFLVVAFQNMDGSLEEAALTAGAGMRAVFFRITLRLAAPAIWSVFLLSFIESVTTLEAPLFIGMPASIYTVPSEIYRDVGLSLVPTYGTASALAVALMLVVGLAIVWYQRAVHAGGSYQTVTGRGFRPRRMHIGRHRWVGQLAVATLLTCMALPMVAVLWASVLVRVVEPANWSGALRLLTDRNYVEALQSSHIVQATWNSLLIGVTSATGVVLLSLAIAWLLERVRGTAARVTDVCASLPLVSPGILMGLGILLAYLHMPVPVYGTVWLLVLAFIPLFLPYGVRYVHAGLLTIGTELEESARVSGAGAGRTVARITLPLLRSAVAAAWLFTFLIVVRELDAAILLYGPNTPVIAGVLFDEWNSGSTGVVAAFGLLVAAGSGLVALIVQRVAGRLAY